MDGADVGGWEERRFFVEGPSGSEEECGDQEHGSVSWRRAADLGGGGSPPLLLAFSITSGEKPRDAQTEEEEEEEEEEEAVEDWMILGGGEQSGDSSIRLNLSYWNSSEEDSPDEGQSSNSEDTSWAVSEKDKSDASGPPPERYFLPGRPQTCGVCNRIGHPGSSCYYHKKCPTCVLCGIRGHVCRECPSRPCPSCGLPSHGLRPCGRPPVWNQHCQRCGVTGHLLDACPDTWRQYHLTVTLEAPHRPRKQKRKKPRAYCYNCSGRGHYGHDCTKRRMISGTSPSVPYVCRYDTVEHGVKELPNAAPEPDPRPPEPTKGSDTGSLAAKEESGPKPERWGRAGRRKTWPERRRERREVKRLRREAQARRSGAASEPSRGSGDDDGDFTADSFRSPLQGHRQSTVSPRKKRKGEEGGGRTRKMERWKRRGGIKRADFHVDADVGTENFHARQRVRQRRR